jgi:hypothetical protein
MTEFIQDYTLIAILAAFYAGVLLGGIFAGLWIEGNKREKDCYLNTRQTDEHGADYE